MFGWAMVSGAALLMAGSVAMAGDLTDVFAIEIGDAISDGVPGPGAGNLEEPGAVDVYTFTVARPLAVYFDENSGSCGIQWRCEAPDGSLLYNNNAICIGDPGEFELSQIGEYTIEVFSPSDETGTYGFTLWEVPAPEVFAIGLNQPVSQDVPGPGAGQIEQPGAVDVYMLTISSPVTAYFDEMGGSCAVLWQAVAPDGTELFSNNAICNGDPGIYVLDQIGDYVITVHGSQSTIGTYSFQVWSVPPPEVFSIGLDQVVSQDAPEPGAGNIEQPGAVDAYSLTVVDPVLVYFDELAGSCGIQWRTEAPDGTVLFDNNAMCVGDPAEQLLDQVGSYVISVYGHQSAIGTYSFEVVTVKAVDMFTIGLDETVADGVPGPGAGNIEEPGSVDEYTLNVTEPVLVYFDEQDGSCSIQWRAEAPGGEVLFDNDAMCSGDPGLVMLDQIGEYLIHGYGGQSATGTYSFTIWDVGEPDVFTIDIGEVISEGVPGEGAGFVEKPGRTDIYELTIDAEDIICVETFSGSCTLGWSVEGPGGDLLVDSQTWCSNTGNTVALPGPGVYAFSVQDAGDFVGSYSFVINTGSVADFNGDCAVNVTDLLALLSAWGDCPAGDDCPEDLNDDNTVNVSDLLILLGAWGG